MRVEGMQKIEASVWKTPWT